MSQVQILSGCDKCGQPQLKQHNYCKKCLQQYWEKQLEDVTNADYLSDNFKLHLKSRYNRLLTEIKKC